MVPNHVIDAKPFSVTAFFLTLDSFDSPRGACRARLENVQLRCRGYLDDRDIPPRKKLDSGSAGR
jgi:hypothetical protein